MGASKEVSRLKKPSRTKFSQTRRDGRAEYNNYCTNTPY